MIQDNYLIEKAKTCCFSGHRNLDKDFNIKQLKVLIEKLIKGGFNKFLVGMALGFDTECFKVLQGLKSKYDIKIVACIPCPEQAKNFSLEQIEEYNKMLECADEKKVLSEHYTSYCMHKRNRYMVDNSSLLVCYLKRDYGGTKNTYDYAIKKGIQIIKI